MKHKEKPSLLAHSSEVAIRVFAFFLLLLIMTSAGLNPVK